MRTAWREDGVEHEVVAPLSLVVTACAPVADVAPHADAGSCATAPGATALLLVDLGGGRDRLGGSCLAQVYGRIGDVPPDLDDPARVAVLFAAVRELADGGLLLAYHDRSDGGLARHACSRWRLPGAGRDRRRPRRARAARRRALQRGARRRPAGRASPTRAQCAAVLARHGLAAFGASHRPRAAGGRIRIASAGRTLIEATRRELRAAWSETTWRMQRAARRARLRGRGARRAPRCRRPGPGLATHLRSGRGRRRAVRHQGARPSVAILREQGVNSQVEMAAAFDRAGFDAVDVHMTDLIDAARDARGLPRPRRLRRLLATATCSVRARAGPSRSCSTPRARALFEAFFARAGHVSRSASATAAR